MRVRHSDEATAHMSFGSFQYFLFFYTGLAWAADAMETMILSFLGPSIVCAWQVGPAAQSALTSVVFAGMLIGVYTLGAISDALGRRKGFMFSALLLAVAGLASAASPSLVWLLISRGIVGVALGGTPIALTIFAEFLPPFNRGKWLLAVQFCWSIGTMFEALLAAVILPTWGWRWLLVASALPLIPLAVLYPWLPETPHWLFAKRRNGAAHQVLEHIDEVNNSKAQHDGGLVSSLLHVLKTRPNIDYTDHSYILSTEQEEYDDDYSVSALEHHHSSSLGLESPRSVSSINHHQHRTTVETLKKNLFILISPKYIRTTVLLWCIWFVNAILYYGLVLLTTSLSLLNDRSSSSGSEEYCKDDGTIDMGWSVYGVVLLTTAAEAPGLLVALYTVDKYGRRWTLKAGMSCCIVAIIGLILGLMIPSWSLQICMLFLARAAIEGTFSCLYVYTPEVFPTGIRSTGVSLCSALGRIGGLLAPFITVLLVEHHMPFVSLYILLSLCAVAAVATSMLEHETAGQHLSSSSCHDDAVDGN